MNKQSVALDIIYNSRYSEFPSIIASIQLAMYFAKVDKRDIKAAMRECARRCLLRAKNEHLRNTLIVMSASAEPTNEMANLYICQLKMRDELMAELQSSKETIRSRDLLTLRSL